MITNPSATSAYCAPFATPATTSSRNFVTVRSPVHLLDEVCVRRDDRFAAYPLRRRERARRLVQRTGERAHVTDLLGRRDVAVDVVEHVTEEVLHLDGLGQVAERRERDRVLECPRRDDV